MHQSHTYASRGSKTAFVEIAERRAEISRLQRQVEGTQTESLRERALLVVGEVRSRSDHLIHGLGNRLSQLRVTTRS